MHYFAHSGAALFHTEHVERFKHWLSPSAAHAATTLRFDWWPGISHHAASVGAASNRTLCCHWAVRLAAPDNAVDLPAWFVSTFNLLAGGPRNGYNILIDSNVDWGQDLLRLKRWMDENEVASVKLSYFGSADPQALGITYEPLPGDPLHRDLWWLCRLTVPIQSRAYMPSAYTICRKCHCGQKKTVYAWFRAREPDEWIGNSIAIYEVP